jgi:Leucine-rich repeat (LRR) protein
MKNQITTIILFLTILTSCNIKQEKKLLPLSELQNQKVYKKLDSLPKNLELVYRVDLSDNNLKKIPEIIFKLRNLQELNVSLNNLTELNHLEELQNLQILNIGMNDFKTFPNEITKLKSLKSLDIWWNDIRTFPEAFYENNVNIEELDLTSMFEFDFTNNLSKIHRFKNLRQLNLGNNQIKNLNIEFNKLSNLEVFGYIRQDKIDAKSIILELSKCKKLKTIHFSVNHIKKLPSEISLLDNLEELNLYENELTNLPNNLLKMKRLKSITLDGNKIDEKIILEFETKMPKTTFIY